LQSGKKLFQAALKARDRGGELVAVVANGLEWCELEDDAFTDV
jgi:hypothetical protein